MKRKERGENRFEDLDPNGDPDLPFLLPDIFS
jgi:hypothetical protein